MIWGKTIYKSLQIAAILLIVSSQKVHSQQSAGLPKQEQIHLLIRYYIEEGGFNGNVLIAEDGKIIYENSAGWANKAENIPITLSTPVYLASVSKQFTAMAIMILEEQGKLDYDDNLKEYLPGLGDYAKKITVRHLLNHTSGFPDYFEMEWDEPGLTNAVLYEKVKNNVKQLNFRPGSKFRYNNTGYMFLSLIVENVSGMPFFAFVDRYISEPLGLENTWVFDLRNNVRNESLRAIGYQSNMKREDDYYLLTTGDGGMYSTVEDLYLWDRALYSNKLVSRESINEAFMPVVLANGSTENYGFGWRIGSNLNGKSVYHSGGLAGFRTYIERQIEVENLILIENNNSFNDIDEMRNILVKILDGRPYTFPDS